MGDERINHVLRWTTRTVDLEELVDVCVQLQRERGTSKDIGQPQRHPMRFNGPWVNQSRGVLGSAIDSPCGMGGSTTQGSKRAHLDIPFPLQLAFTHSRLFPVCVVQVSIHSLSTTRLPNGATFFVNIGPEIFVCGRGISPEHAWFWSLARWGHDPLPCGRPARHLGLSESCRFCDASVGDLQHSLLSALSF